MIHAKMHKSGWILTENMPKNGQTSIRWDPPSDSDEWKDVKGKFEKHFSPNPGKGS